MKTPARILLSIGIAAVLLALLAAWGDVDPAEMVRACRRIPLATFGLALLVHGGLYLVRAARYRVLIPSSPARPRPSLGRMLSITAAHNLASYVLPAKTGEATLVLYLRSLCGIPAAEGVATWVVSRLMDGAALCACLSTACFVLVARAAAGETAFFATLGAVLAAGSGALLLAGLRGDALVRALVRVSHALRLDRTALGARLLSRSTRLAEAFRICGADGRLWIAALMSVPLWIGVFAYYAILARGSGLSEQLSFAEATFGSGLAVLTNLLPVSGFAALGTQETGWVFGFHKLGVEPDLALTTGFGVHMVQLFNTCLFGLLGHLAMGFGRVRPLDSALDQRE